MHSTLIPVNKIFLGGSYSYYITKDRNFFIKVCKGKGKWITKEFFYLKKYWNKLGIDNLQLIEPINYSEAKEFLITKFVDSKKLVDILNPKIYYIFGKKLKIFHEKGFSHSHLEVHDILYNNGKFILADVPFFNEREQIHDLVSIKLSLNIYKLKRPWYWYKYKICSKEFFNGYALYNSKELEKEYEISIKKRIRLYLRRDIIYKIKAYLLKLIHKSRLL